MMCCMIAELGVYVSTVAGDNSCKMANQSILFAGARYTNRETIRSRATKYDSNVRLPWIHRREPFDIQSLNTPASKNHVGGAL